MSQGARAADPATGGRRWPFVAALVLFALLLSGGAYSLAGLARGTEWLRHAAELRFALERLRFSLREAETGTGYYVVTGDPAFLARYAETETEWQAQLHRIRSLTSDSPEQQQRLARVEQLAASGLQALAERRALYDGGRRGPQLTSTLARGKRLMDDTRRTLSAIEREEARLDMLRQEEALNRWRSAVFLFIGGAFALLFALAAVWTERKVTNAQRRRADELARAHELLRIVIQGIDIGITVQAKTGELVYANSAGAKIIGFDTPEALLEAPLSSVIERFDVFDAAGNPFPVANLPSRAALQGLASDEIVLRFRARGTRQDRWSVVRSVPAFDPSGVVIYAINFFHEVTEKTRAEHQRAFLLRVADELGSSLDYEKTLKTVAQLAVPLLADWCAVDLLIDQQIRRVAIAHVDPAKLELVAELQRLYPSNPAAKTGVPEVIRTGKAELVPEIPREMIRAAARDEEHLRLIDQLELRSYLATPLRVRGTTIGALTLAMAESDRRHTEADLEFAQEVADRAALAIDNARLFQEAERARHAVAVQLEQETRRRREAEEGSRFAEMFIGMLGHDLRNPLNAVRMAATLLRRKTGDREIVARIESSTQRMSSMVDQLLDLTRCRLAGGIAIDRRQVELGAVISAVIEELRLSYPDREIRWQRREVRGNWDQDRTAQVLSNLLGNALEHGDRAKPITVELTEADGGAHFSVHSHGDPIQPELIPVIFDPYRRGTARDERSKGLGLGLFITQQIVVAHGGRIEVRSIIDEGTRFDVFLPGAIVESMASTEKRSASS